MPVEQLDSQCKQMEYAFSPLLYLLLRYKVVACMLQTKFYHHMRRPKNNFNLLSHGLIDAKFKIML